MQTPGYEFFLDTGDAAKLIVVSVRLTAAMLLGGLIGWEREHYAKAAAGTRTYMLVAIGSALFTVGPALAGMDHGDLSRVIQGIATGIGFVGAGTILKLTDPQEVRGLTTAAGIWASAAMGVAVGVGWLWPSVVGCLLIWFVLFVLRKVETWLQTKPPPGQRPEQQIHEGAVHPV